MPVDHVAEGASDASARNNDVFGSKTESSDLTSMANLLTRLPGVAIITGAGGTGESSLVLQKMSQRSPLHPEEWEAVKVDFCTG